MPLRANFLDRLVGFLAPEAGRRRVVARAQMDFMMKRGGFDGARMDRKGSPWKNGPTGPNTSLYGDLPTLRRRANDLVRNVPICKKGTDALVSHTVGTGLRPTFVTDSPAQRRRLMKCWEAFVDNADARRQTDFYGMQEQGVRAMFIDGEFLPMRDMRREKGRAVYSQLLLPGAHLDHAREGVFEDLITRLGVAIAKDAHYPVGYWLFPMNPDDAILWGAFPYSRLVPADGVMHVYRIRELGAMRGYSELASVLPVARDITDYWASALEKANMEAAFAAFVTSEEDRKPNIGTREENGANGVSQTIAAYSSGMIIPLQPGESVQFPNASQNNNFSPFMRQARQDVAAGLGVATHMATGDLSEANYSSLRTGTSDTRRFIEMVREHTICPMWLNPTMREVITFGRLNGDLAAVDENVRWNWIPPANEPIDPVKDMAADIMAVRSGRMTWTQFVASWGRDPHEQLAEIRATVKAFDEAGVVLDIDPRKVDGKGALQGLMQAAGQTDDDEKLKKD